MRWKRDAVSLGIVLYLLVIQAGLASEKELPELLLHHREAMGGKEVLLSIHSVHAVWKMQMMELSGTLETWSAAPDKSKMHIKFPVIEQTQGDDGSIAWTLDQNGQVTTKKSKYGQLQTTAPVLPEYQYMFPSNAIHVSDIGEDVVDGVRYRVLEVSEPWNEVPRKLYLDPKTFLVRIEKGTEEGIPTTVQYGKYERWNGLMTALKFVQKADIEGMPETAFELASIEFNNADEESLFRPPDNTRIDFEFDTSEKKTELTLKKQDEHIFVDVFIDGKGPYCFLLDSGAGTSILDASLARAMSLEIQKGMHALGVGGLKDLGAITVKSLKLGGLTLHNLRMYASDLSFLSEAFGEDIHGVLGYDLFIRTVITLDIAYGTLRIQAPETFKYSGSGTVIPGEIKGNLMYINGRLDDVWDGLFRVDTGASGALHIHGPFAAKYALKDKYSPTFPVKIKGVGGEEESILTRVHSLKIGKFTMKNVLADFPGSTERGAMSAVDSIGTLGNMIWSRFTVIFDYSGNRLILEPNASLNSPMLLNRTGFFAGRNDKTGKWKVTNVFKNTPAYKAGLRTGDILLKVNKISAEKLSRKILKAMSRGPAGTVMRLKIKRNGSARTIKFRLADYL